MSGVQVRIHPAAQNDHPRARTARRPPEPPCHRDAHTCPAGRRRCAARPCSRARACLGDRDAGWRRTWRRSRRRSCPTRPGARCRAIGRTRTRHLPTGRGSTKTVSPCRCVRTPMIDVDELRHVGQDRESRLEPRVVDLAPVQEDERRPFAHRGSFRRETQPLDVDEKPDTVGQPNAHPDGVAVGTGRFGGASNRGGSRRPPELPPATQAVPPRPREPRRRDLRRREGRRRTDG